MSIGKELEALCQNRSLIVRRLFQEAIAECKRAAALGLHSSTYFIDEDVDEEWVGEVVEKLCKEDIFTGHPDRGHDGYLLWMRWFE
jgi:hypothetical protein